MRIAILSGRLARGWHVSDLQRAAAARGHDAIAIPWTTLQSQIALDGAPALLGDGHDLRAFDAVVPRTMPPGNLEQVIFRMDLLQRLSLAGTPIVNGPRAMEIAADKYLALARLAAKGLPVPPTITCQRFEDAMAAFEALGRDVVVKPLFGSEGFGIMRLTDPGLAERALSLLARTGSVLYLQRFIEHRQQEYRLHVTGDQITAAVRRESTQWRGNAAQGARCVAVSPDGALAKLALDAARACCCEVAGVDVLIGRETGPVVLEVNAVPGWRALAPATGIDVADALITYLESRCAGSASRPHVAHVEQPMTGSQCRSTP